MINVAVLGYGTVGSGVVEVIEKNKDVITRNVGEELNVKYVLDLRDFPGDPIQEKVVHDAEVIFSDETVAIVCETMGGMEPAFTFTKKALMSGKSVCTSNKELVAAHGPELLKIAKEHNCSYLFEASVGGGIPIIRPLISCLTAEKITGIKGILNGTTNYILTKMSKDGAEFETVLKEAQELGYAERNPAADVEGYDACRKIAILTSLAYGMQVDYEDIYRPQDNDILLAEYIKQISFSLDSTYSFNNYNRDQLIRLILDMEKKVYGTLIIANDYNTYINFKSVFDSNNIFRNRIMEINDETGLNTILLSPTSSKSFNTFSRIIFLDPILNMGYIADLQKTVKSTIYLPHSVDNVSSVLKNIDLSRELFGKYFRLIGLWK